MVGLLMPQPLSQRDVYAYGDYRAWPDERRDELIDGLAYAMSSAPSIVHQRLTGEIHRQAANC
jgi:hypothetical protein